MKISGGLSTNHIFYGAQGIEQRRAPYTYFLSGNLNIDLYGWSVPLSVTYSNQQASFSQPFNQYALHPTYQGITGHFGYTSMTFSNYTLNGHLFLGAGVEWEPQKKLQKLRVAAMYGRLRKAIEPDTLYSTPAFKRMGYGFKIGYGTDTDFLDIILFHAADDIHSLPFVPDSLDVLPEENLVVSFNGAKKITKKLTLKAELASSAITRDTRAAKSEIDNGFSKFGKLYTPRQSSAYYQAFKSALTYQATIYTIGVGYERVEPGYRTLGAYYFNQDMENMTVSGQVSLLQGKTTISTQLGLQRNNLHNDQLSSMRRGVGSLTIGYVPHQKLNINGSYSNFQTYTHVRLPFERINQLTPYDNLDTLDFTQISQNANLAVGYLLKSTESRRHHLNTNVSFQTTSDQQQQTAGTNFYNFNTIYNYHIVPRGIRLSLGFNGSRGATGKQTTVMYGPTVALQKQGPEKKMVNTLSYSWNLAQANQVSVNRVHSLRFSSTYALLKKHRFSLSAVGINREDMTGERPAFSEITGTLGYSYRF